jgi:phospholipase C
MKLAAKSLLLILTTTATLAYAQTGPNTPIKHVIVVIQENRTPDNLFGSDAFASSPQLPGADLVKQGKCGTTNVTLTPNVLNACFDPDHGHSYVPPPPALRHDAWVLTYDSGKMDGACNVRITNKSCTTLTYPN